MVASHRAPRPAVVLLRMLLSGLLTAGCGASSVPTGCPAIGWPVTLSVADPTGAPAVELCVDGGCVSSAASTEGRGPAYPISEVVRSASGWDFVLAGAYDEVTVRRLDADGSMLSDRTVRPEWVRTGGSEECGGPQRAVVTP